MDLFEQLLDVFQVAIVLGVLVLILYDVFLIVSMIRTGPACAHLPFLGSC